MNILLDHLSVRVRDRVESMRFYAEIFGVPADGPRSRSGWLTVSSALSLIFEEGSAGERSHYAFRVEPGDFDVLRGRLGELRIPFGSDAGQSDGEVKIRPDRSRSVYFSDPNGHGVELITAQ